MNNKPKKGISLIVLVITIIVMIILAATIIISLNNNGIVNKAQDAVDKTNEKQVEELASLAWAEAYADNVGKPEEELQPILKAAVEKALTDNNLNKEDYGMVVTTKGVTIAKGWLQTKDRTVVKGDKVLNIGSDISYDETNGGTITGLTNVDWQVLGAENGELLIMSTSDVKERYWLGGANFSEAKTVYETGINKLNEICAPYGTGAYATGARSITVEDVDRVTGYDKTKYEYTSGSYKIKYGESITYYWDNTDGIYYKTSSGVTGNLLAFPNPFIYHNGKEWVTYNRPTNLTDKQEICTLTPTYYNYDVDEKTDLVKGTDVYSMLFGNDDTNYWLASTFFRASERNPELGFFLMLDGIVSGVSFVVSDGMPGGYSCGVRAVVTLAPEFNP